ncbi:MAG: RIP metalloprotease RseP [Pseudomonadota bacterium]
MEFLSEIPVVGGVLGIAIPFLVVLSVVVFVHEYGHYIVGRWCGIQAETFSIGFGKRLFSWVDKRGTRWQVAIIPLGGFVKFVGDMDPASAKKSDEDLAPELQKVAFHNASIGARALTVLAGPMANFLLSIVIFTGIALVLGHSTDKPVVGEVYETDGVSEGLQVGDRVFSVGGTEVETWNEMLHQFQTTDGAEVPVEIERDGTRQTVIARYQNRPIVDQVSPGMPAAQAGMRHGDVILEVNGEAVSSFHQLRVLTSELALNTEIDVLVQRDGEARLFEFTPDVVERAHPETGEMVDQATMGISSLAFGGLRPTREPVGFLTALEGGVQATWSVIVNTLTFLGDMIFTNADTSQLGGPIGIAQISADQAKAGIGNLISLIGLLSTSIGLLNLFPIPILDGGHLVFYAAEALRGKPLGERWMNAAMGVGLSLVLLLMGFATYNDLTRLAG